MTFAIAGVPVEEALAAAPGVLAGAGVLLAYLRNRVRRRTPPCTMGTLAEI